MMRWRKYSETQKTALVNYFYDWGELEEAHTQDDGVRLMYMKNMI